jgi:GNAT superfamily N-acetyltransferase
MNLDQLHIRSLSRKELDTAVEWAAAEGWNPGLHDADVFWATDPDGFLGAELNGELVATGSVVSYAGQYGFMGFFIVRPDLRGQGIGTRLWLHRRDHLRARLSPGAAIGMDGVFAMQDWYAKGGFTFSHRNLRMQGIGAAGCYGSDIVPVSAVPVYNNFDFSGPLEFVQKSAQLSDKVMGPDYKAKWTDAR